MKGIPEPARCGDGNGDCDLRGRRRRNGDGRGGRIARLYSRPGRTCEGDASLIERNDDGARTRCTPVGRSRGARTETHREKLFSFRRVVPPDRDGEILGLLPFGKGDGRREGDVIRTVRTIRDGNRQGISAPRPVRRARYADADRLAFTGCNGAGLGKPDHAVTGLNGDGVGVPSERPARRQRCSGQRDGDLVGVLGSAVVHDGERYCLGVILVVARLETEGPAFGARTGKIVAARGHRPCNLRRPGESLVGDDTERHVTDILLNTGRVGGRKADGEVVVPEDYLVRAGIGGKTPARRQAARERQGYPLGALAYFVVNSLKRQGGTRGIRRNQQRRGRDHVIPVDSRLVSARRHGNPKRRGRRLVNLHYHTHRAFIFHKLAGRVGHVKPDRVAVRFNCQPRFIAPKRALVLLGNINPQNNIFANFLWIRILQNIHLNIESCHPCGNCHLAHRGAAAVDCIVRRALLARLRIQLVNLVSVIVVFARCCRRILNHNLERRLHRQRLQFPGNDNRRHAAVSIGLRQGQTRVHTPAILIHGARRPQSNAWNRLALLVQNPLLALDRFPEIRFRRDFVIHGAFQSRQGEAELKPRVPARIQRVFGIMVLVSALQEYAGINSVARPDLEGGTPLRAFLLFTLEAPDAKTRVEPDARPCEPQMKVRALKGLFLVIGPAFLPVVKGMVVV